MTRHHSWPADPDGLDAARPDGHLTVELLTLLVQGDLPAERLLGFFLDHLQDACSQCARALDQFAARPSDAAAVEGEAGRRPTSCDAAAYSAAFDAAVAGVRSLLRTLGGMLGAEQAAELEALPAADRYRRLISEPALNTPDLCLRLLERAWAAAAGDPREAAELGRLALAVAGRLDPRLFPAGLILDCQADCWTLLGELDLHRGDERAGELALRCAESLLSAGSGDPLTLARVTSGRAQLLRQRGDLEGCLSELARAVDLYGAGGDPHVRGRTLLHRGLVLQELGRASEAREILQAGIGLLDPERDRELAARGQAALRETLGGPNSASPPH